MPNEEEGSSPKVKDFNNRLHPIHNDENHFESGQFGNLRWVVLFLSCWIMFGNYYAFDNPSSLNIPLRGWLAPAEQELLFQYRLSLMYSVYSIPNIVLPFFVGRWLDKFGSRTILLFLSALVTFGQALVAFGIQSGTFSITIVGRILFGLGGESLAVAQSRLVSEWFQGKELSLAIGLNLSVARVGTVFNNIISPWIASKWSLPGAFWIGFSSCLISFICTLATISVDKAYRIENLNHHQHEHELVRSKSQKKLLKNYSNFEHAFWLLAFICFLFYGCMIPFNNVASDYLQKRYFPGNLVKSNFAMSLPDSIAMFLVPIMGVYLDRSGGVINTISLGGFCFIFGHFILGFGSSLSACLLGLFLLGAGYSTMLSFWSCVPPLVEMASHSTAYGILTSSCNLSVSVVSLVIAWIVSIDPSYQLCGLFFSTVAFSSILLILIVSGMNVRRHLGLNSKHPVHRRRRRHHLSIVNDFEDSDSLLSRPRTELSLYLNDAVKRELKDQ